MMEPVAVAFSSLFEAALHGKRERFMYTVGDNVFVQGNDSIQEDLAAGFRTGSIAGSSRRVSFYKHCHKGESCYCE